MSALPDLRTRAREAGFTLVELTMVVVISTIALIAIYQTLITQERTYRYQSAAIDAQGTSRMALSVIAAELREISASAGQTAGFGGTDLLMATRDSLRIRAFRKVGIICSTIAAGAGQVDVWVPGELFADRDRILYYQPGSTNTLDDDAFAQDTLSDAALGSAAPGAILRSFVNISYGNYTYDGMNVLGRVNNGTFEPLVGPILPTDSGGVTFRYFDANNAEIANPSSDAQRSAVSRVLITVRSVSRGGNPMGGDWVDSVSTNVYLRGN